MYRYSVNDQLLKDNIFILCFKELSFRKVLLDRKARTLEIISLICSCSLLVSFFIFVFTSFFYGTKFISIYGIVIVISGLLAILSVMGSIWCSKRYIRSRFPEYSLLVNRNPFHYSTNILFLIRCVSVYEFLRQERSKFEHIDILLEYFENLGETLQKRRWLPIATYATFFFPFWSVVVNKLWDNQLRELILLALLFPACVLVWRNNIQTMLLSKSQQYNHVSRILRTIKSYPKF